MSALARAYDSRKVFNGYSEFGPERTKVRRFGSFPANGTKASHRFLRSAYETVNEIRRNVASFVESGSVDLIEVRRYSRFLRALLRVGGKDVTRYPSGKYVAVTLRLLLKLGRRGVGK